MEVFILWFIASIIVGYAAKRRCNRDGIGWFLLACLISPLLAGGLLAVVGAKAPRPQARWVWQKDESYKRGDFSKVKWTAKAR
jgi:hypothetical protein